MHQDSILHHSIASHHHIHTTHSGMSLQTNQVQGMYLLLLLLLLLLSHPSYQCPAPPTCCESGQYALDECGCCLKCAKAELQTCGGANDISGRCASGLQCLKTCCKLFLHLSYCI